MGYESKTLNAEGAPMRGERDIISLAEEHENIDRQPRAHAIAPHEGHAPIPPSGGREQPPHDARTKFLLNVGLMSMSAATVLFFVGGITTPFIAAGVSLSCMVLAGAHEVRHGHTIFGTVMIGTAVVLSTLLMVGITGLLGPLGLPLLAIGTMIGMRLLRH